MPPTFLPSPYRHSLALALALVVSGTVGLRAENTLVALPIPAITFTSSTYSDTYSSDLLFDGLPTAGSSSNLGGQWAGTGAGPVYVDLDFGGTITTDCFAYAQRLGGIPSSDKAVKFELYFSNTPTVFPAIPDLTIDSGINTANNEFTLYPMGETHSGRFLRFRVTGNGGNVGGSELRFYQGQAGQPAVSNGAATGIGPGSATLRGTITDPGTSLPTVTIFYGLSNGGSDPESWDGAVSLGHQTGAFETTVHGLQPGRTYFFTARAANASGEAWAGPVLDFTTAVAAPGIANLAATDLTAGGAVVGAEVTDTGGDAPLVTIFYGTSDGGTDSGAWSGFELLGPQAGAATVPLRGLAPNTTYQFRAMAANAGGTSWAPGAATFTTTVATLPSVINGPASQANAFSAILAGEVTDPGNDPPSVTIFYGPSDGGTDPGAWEDSVDLGIQAAAFQQLITNLQALRTYYFRARATNAAGTAWAPGSTSFDTTAFVPVTVGLNEFLADTDRDRDDLRLGLPYCDEDGDPEDWIELHNPGTSAIDIGYYHLTDNAGQLAKWRFPSPTIIPANGYLVVFASSKNRSVAGAELHTNFRLDPDGEYLALVGSDGATILRSFSPAFPPLAKHFSYGLVPPAGNGTYDHFETPTPGSANTTTPGQPAGEVVFSLASQTFTSNLSLALRTASPTGVVRYTTDGSAPTASSPPYPGPIAITTTTQVRARSYEAGFAPGPIGSETYLMINPNVSTFTSDLPIVILEGFKSGRPDTDQAMHWTIYEPAGTSGRSSPASAPDFQSRGRMRVRGSSSAGWPKYSLTMEAWNNLDEDQDVAPLGLPAGSDWVLSGRYEFDRALMRNELIFALSNQIGRYAPRTRFVEVLINTGNGHLDYNEDYMGVYALTEKIKRGGNRVDVERLTKADLAVPELTGGYMIKIDRNDPGDSGWTTALGIPGTEPFGGEVRLNHVYPKEDTIPAPQRDYIRGYLDEFEAAINAPGHTHPATGRHYTDYIDVGSWVDHIWLNILAQNPDALRLSTHMFKPRGGKLHAGPVWDFDRTMQSTDGRDNDPHRFSATQPATDLLTWGWWEQLFAEPDFKQRWIDRWAGLRDEAFSDANLTTRIDGFAAELAEAQARNFIRWSAKAPRGGSHAAEVALLKDWLAQHTAWIDRQFLPRPFLTPGTGQAVSGSVVSVSAGDNHCYFTTDGSDPRAPGGGASPGATLLVAGSGITITGPSDIVIRAYQRGEWSAPVHAIYTMDPPASPTSLVVSEIMYHPLDPTPAELLAGFTQASDFEFLEIHNPSAQRIALHGVVISAAFDFDFSGGAIPALDPGGYALVVRDRAAFEERYGTGHPVAGEYGDNAQSDGGQKLENSGEGIVITAADTSPILDFAYGDALPWPTAADGDGYSLVLRRPADRPDHSLPEHWRSSTLPGGNPGAADGTAFSGTAGADGDRNGIDDLLDYAMANTPGTNEGLPAISRTTGATLVSILHNLAADDVALDTLWSHDLVTWRVVANDFALVGRVPDATGRETITYAVPDDVDAAPSIFVRLRASVLPAGL